MLILLRSLDTLLGVYMFLVLMRVAWSWTDHFPRNPLVRRAWRPPFVYVLRFLFAVVDPAVRPFRKFIPVGGGMFLDVGPLVLFLLVVVARAGVQRLIVNVGF